MLTVDNDDLNELLNTKHPNLKNLVILCLVINNNYDKSIGNIIKC